MSFYKITFGVMFGVLLAKLVSFVAYWAMALVMVLFSGF
jgi:hypothetical protein